MTWGLAVDIGGTKVEAALVAGDDGRLVARRRAPTTHHADGEALFSSVARLCDEVLDASAAEGVAAPEVCGVGCGGPMAPSGPDGSMAVTPLNIPVWVDFPLQARLAGHLGLPTHVDNDAKALALGEGWMGAAAGERDFIAMVVSTGVGGGIVLDGRLLDGARGNAGHIGHVIVEPDGHRCGCGARGCLEAEASGTAIAAITGRPAVEADTATRERTGRLVGRAVATVANLLDLRLACVAGSVALGYGDAFFAAAQAEIDDRARLDFSRGTRIVPAGLHDEGPLVGAAAVGFRALDRGVA